LAECKIDVDASPHFKQLREYWKKHRYPSIDTDLDEAFTNIRKDIQANQRWRVPRFSAALQGYELFKYRQKNRSAREGASGGWRIYTLFDSDTNTLYPLIVFPKKAMADADDDTIRDSITALLAIFQGTLFDNSS